MKSQVLHTMCCYSSAKATGEIWNWPLSGVKGLSNKYGAPSWTRCAFAAPKTWRAYVLLIPPTALLALQVYFPESSTLALLILSTCPFFLTAVLRLPLNSLPSWYQTTVGFGRPSEVQSKGIMDPTGITREIDIRRAFFVNAGPGDDIAGNVG